MKSNEVLLQIKKDRITLLSNVKKCIINNSNNFGVSASEISKLLTEEEKTSKKMETIINIEQYISELASRIVNAKDENEVIEIRKELNKSINKVKNEMTKRNIDEESLADYQEKAKNLRKDISRLIRYHKRIEKINRIEELNNKENVSEDETIELKKLIKNEKNYNARNIKEYIPVKNSEELKINPLNYKKTNKKNLYCGSLKTFFDGITMHYNKQYAIAPTKEYTNSRIKNILIFFGNISKYISNGKKLKIMKKDLVTFYNGDDLVAYTEYVKNRNSFTHGLKNIFSKTYLSSDYSKNLNKHDKCAEWLENFYIFNQLELPAVEVRNI